ncbi:hypothetical protein BGZ96_010013 [Linnemannia gamsii]|uniref:Uncharacterized protein n=1 Tax=Linnemannia gamsii TaxID=64522 RepID=A0ABQ7JVA3_9FUNG|nr:hypothetical protein BGZ96_010013 [Linnemannia gamsii]
MLSLNKSTLSISLALITVVSAVPQGLGFDAYDPIHSSGSGFISNSGSNINYVSGSSAGYDSDLGLDYGSTTEVPVSPINNVRPIVNVFPPNINDYSYDYNYSNNYGFGASDLDWGLGGGGGGPADLGALSAGIPAIMGGGPVNIGALGAGIPVMMGGDGGFSNLDALSAGVSGMVNPADLGALGGDAPPIMGMANAADVSGIIVSLQDALRGVSGRV